MTPRRRDRAAGFTLLEVIVALAILSVAVVASIQGFAQGLRLLKLSGDHQRATLYADLKLREVVTPEEGHEAEDDAENGFRWERSTTVIETPDLAGDGTQEPAWRVIQITVRVHWDERRHVEVATLRTVPTAGAAQDAGPPGGEPQTGPTPRDAPEPTAPAGRGGGSSTRPGLGTPPTRGATPTRPAPPGPARTPGTGGRS